MFTEECHMAFCFYPLLFPFQERHENFYENFLPLILFRQRFGNMKIHSFGSLLLASIIVQLESALISLYQKQPSRGVFRKMFWKYAANLPEKTHADVWFIEFALWHGCSPVNSLHIFRTQFPKNTSRRLLLLYSHSAKSILYFVWTISLIVCKICTFRPLYSSL